MPSVPRSFWSAVVALPLALALAGAPARAQYPALPTLQTPFAAPGIAVGVNYGSAEDVQAYALAAGWVPSSGRVVVAGGAGTYDPDGGASGFGWGLRTALVPRTPWRNLGVALFVGAGGANTSDLSLVSVPLGASVGYRWAVGADYALAIYAAPFYSWSWLTVQDETGQDEETERGGQFRLGAGLDFAFSPRWGVTAGIEIGQEADAGEIGPTSPSFGIGLSYAFGRD